MKWRNFGTESPSGLHCTNRYESPDYPIGWFSNCQCIRSAANTNPDRVWISCYGFRSHEWVWISPNGSVVAATRNQIHMLIYKHIHTVCTCMYTDRHTCTYANNTHEHELTHTHIHHTHSRTHMLQFHNTCLENYYQKMLLTNILFKVPYYIFFGKKKRKENRN